MKKRYLWALILIIPALIVSCTATPVESKTTAEPAAVAVVQPAAPVAEAAPAAAPAPAPVTPAEAPVVVSSAPAITADDPELDQKFSYVYGHLLAASIKDQGIKLNTLYFNNGSSDFFNMVEPVISEQEINNAFNEFQNYLDGLLTDEQLVQGSDPASAVPLSLFDRFSYGYGYLIMFNLQSQGIIVSLEDYNNGVTDSLAGIALPYTDAQIDELFTAYQERMMYEYFASMDRMSAENLAMAEAFLAENTKSPEITTTASGLQYQVIEKGTGPLPAITDTVKVDYLITFLDGSTGDNSYSRGEPSVFPLGSLIPGFVEGVSLMPVGSYYRFFLHPALAYGEAGNESIPPNSLLVFDVELHEIVK
jgi:FKBP-type peptidyl-prolyl cis-trans isomerase